MLYKKAQKKRFWGWESFSTICRGKRNNKQRYKCNDCGLLFTSKSDGVKLNNRFICFRKWVVGKQTSDQLSLASSYSKRKIQYLFKSYLSKPPQFTIKNKFAINLMIYALTWTEVPAWFYPTIVNFNMHFFPLDKPRILYRD